MKKILFSSLILIGISLGFLSCTDDFLGSSNNNQMKEIKAIIDSEESRTIINLNDSNSNYGKVEWVLHDLISINAGKFEATEVSGTNATFEWIDGQVPTGAITAYYPYGMYSGSGNPVMPSTLKYDPENPGSIAPMHGGLESVNNETPDQRTLVFRNLEGILCLKGVNSNDHLLKSIAIYADQCLSGEYTIGSDYKAVFNDTLNGGHKYICFEMPEGGLDISQGVNLYLPLPATTLTNIRIMFCSTDNMITTMSNATGLLINRSKIKTINLSNKELEMDHFPPELYFDEDGNPSLIPHSVTIDDEGFLTDIYPIIWEDGDVFEWEIDFSTWSNHNQGYSYLYSVGSNQVYQNEGVIAGRANGNQDFGWIGADFSVNGSTGFSATRSTNTLNNTDRNGGWGENYTPYKVKYRLSLAKGLEFSCDGGNTWGVFMEKSSGDSLQNLAHMQEVIYNRGESDVNPLWFGLNKEAFHDGPRAIGSVFTYMVIRKTDVRHKVENITLNFNDYNLYVEQEIDLYATISPKIATKQEIVWESTDTTVAKVGRRVPSSHGHVITNNPGTCQIIARSTDGSEVYAVCNLTVYANDHDDTNLGDVIYYGRWGTKHNDIQSWTIDNNRPYCINLTVGTTGDKDFNWQDGDILEISFVTQPGEGYPFFIGDSATINGPSTGSTPYFYNHNDGLVGYVEIRESGYDWIELVKAYGRNDLEGMGHGEKTDCRIRISASEGIIYSLGGADWKSIKDIDKTGSFAKQLLDGLRTLPVLSIMSSSVVAGDADYRIADTYVNYIKVYKHGAASFTGTTDETYAGGKIGKTDQTW